MSYILQEHDSGHLMINNTFIPFNLEQIKQYFDLDLIEETETIDKHLIVDITAIKSLLEYLRIVPPLGNPSLAEWWINYTHLNTYNS